MANLSRFLLLKPNTITDFSFSTRSFFTTPSYVRRRASVYPLYVFRPRLVSSALAGRECPPSPQELAPKVIIWPQRCRLMPWIVEMPLTVCGFKRSDLYFSRDEIINLYIKTLAQVVGSEEAARRNIYSVSTKHYYQFGAFMSDEHADKLTAKFLKGIGPVRRDSLEKVEKKEYGDKRLLGGEPFINGKAFPYDPKYHKAWTKTCHKVLNEKKQVVPWIVRMEKPKSHLSRDAIIDSYIKTLSCVVDSVDEARMMIYSVSTRCHYAFQIVANGLVAKNLEGLPGVKDVLAYFDEGLEGEDFKLGEPFINGKAVPYDPKYHEGVSCNVCPEFDWFKNKRKDEPAI